MKSIKIFLLFFAINILDLSLVKAQESKSDRIKKIVESQSFVFKAETANPQGGASRQLSSDYDLTITTNSVTSYLPYFGRSYSPPIDPTAGGIKFTSTNFEYKMVAKGNSWQITIIPKDAQGVQQLYLTIFNNGNASLDVVNTTRQGISFSGYIK